MDSQVLLPIVIFIAVLSLAIPLTSRSGSRSAVRRRLDDHRVEIGKEDVKRLTRVQVLKQQTFSRIPLIHSLLSHFRPAQTAARELARANVSLAVSSYLLIRLFAGSGLFLVGAKIIGQPLIALPLVIVGLMMPRIVVIVRARRRLAAFEAQLAEAIDLVVNALRAGYGFMQAIETASRDLNGPIQEELARVVEETNVGANPAVALASISDRVDSYDFALVATAVSVQRTIGGNLSEVLDNIAKTVRERRRVRGEVKALTTGPRVSSYVLGLIPLFLLAWFSATSTSYRDVMFHSTIGKAMIAIATIWSLIGLTLSRKVAVAEYYPALLRSR
jgi:tight adherence protein B